MKTITIFVITLYSTMYAVCYTEKWTRFDRIVALDGDICEGTDVVFAKQDVKDKTFCLLECSYEELCLSVFHDHQNRMCTGCGTAYDSTNKPSGQASGAIYYGQYTCPSDWFNIGDSCYYITGNMDYDDGVQYCLSQSSYPVKMETAEENNNIKNKIRSISFTDQPWAFFTAYTDRAVEGTWTIDGTTIQLSFDDWANKEPNGGNGENCLSFWVPKDYQWGDVSCNSLFKTICEKAVGT